MKLHDDLLKQKYGIKLLAGIDEAGRGPLAGPVVAACVILKEDANLKYVNDSKKLTIKQRDLALKEINDNLVAKSIGIVSAEEIDQLNIYQASILAMERALNNIAIEPELVVIDFMKINTTIKTLSITKGDQLSQVIAAASIVAKTYRDNLMIEYDKTYPEYGFKEHKGYPTKKHLEAIKTYGITPIHRKTFKPIKKE